MTTVRNVDYDRIAHLYDEPLRDHAVDADLTAFLAGRPEPPPTPPRLLDVGCGTGKQQTANRGRFPEALAVGLDRSRGMLEVARRRGPGVAWVHADGTALPFSDGVFDYVSNQFSYHHVADKDRLVREIRRVLRPGGRFVMTNIDPWSMDGWLIYRFFPAALAADRHHFLPAERFAAMLEAAGFVDVRLRRAVGCVSDDLRRFLAYASERHRASEFMVIGDEDYRAGLRRIEAAIVERGTGSTAIDSEFCRLTVTGDRPTA